MRAACTCTASLSSASSSRFAWAVVSVMASDVNGLRTPRHQDENRGGRIIGAHTGTARTPRNGMRAARLPLDVVGPPTCNRRAHSRYWSWELAHSRDRTQA